MNAVQTALIESINNGSRLRELIWNYDLSCSQTLAMNFVTELSKVKKDHLQKIELVGVFQLQENRNKVRELLGSDLTASLFKPDYTDDESADHDCSEEESQPDEEDSHSSQEEDK